EEELSDAFIQAHSKAEVWRIESLEKVFGSVENLDPDTITSLLRRMRQNLAGLWPSPKLQQQAKTKRTDKELKAQIFHGYEAAQDLCASAAEKHPDSWSLPIQLAALNYEESNYRAALDSHPEHSAIKLDSVASIASATEQYVGTLPLEKVELETADAFLTWFYAAMGSPDLEALEGHHQPIAGEFPKIKAALESIPGECRERHYAYFASAINSRLANVSEDLKYRYLESALSITGTHEEIEESAQVFEYYQDLNTEIKLLSRLDGSDTVAFGQPFGLFVDLLHTREIEREAGGFGKYLTNQNSSRYSYNYGRPKEDYRDKFEESSRAILEEHFEIVSLTFHNPKVESRTASQIGWTMTPYAYFLLKAKGPEVDTIPPLKIDLDFLDTSGSVILPVASAAIPLDASSIAGDPRPYRDLLLTMILDDREAESSEQVALELRAAGHGLVPGLDQLVKLPPVGWKLVDTEDRELQVEELDAATDDGAPLSTHEWRLLLESDGETLPANFVFPEVIAELSSMDEDPLTLQKFDDVDLISVESIVSLAGGRDEISFRWGWLLFILLVVV
ncbi:MAG: hypothetical protein AAF357_19040, partial [Verrucomicrobiota bacterium]